MPGRNGQRKPGTARGSPRRSRTAKASLISRHAVKSRCACERGGWGQLSDDGPRQHNSGRSEGPWGSGDPTSWRCTIESATRHCAGLALDHEVHERWMQTGGQGAYVGSRLKRSGHLRKAPSEMPAFQPYRGKPAVRNDREDRGNVGIIRSPVRASNLAQSETLCTWRSSLRGTWEVSCMPGLVCRAGSGIRRRVDERLIVASVVWKKAISCGMKAIRRSIRLARSQHVADVGGAGRIAEDRAPEILRRQALADG
jgi:hypothetical protein